MRLTLCAAGALSLSLLASALATSPTLAQTSASAQDRAEADRLYEEGIKAAIAGDYPSAIIHLQNGYRLDPDARFLYNIAVCYERLDNADKALDFYTRTLKSPNASSDMRTKAAGRLHGYTAKQVATATATAIAQGPATIKPPNDSTSQAKADQGFGGLGWTGVAVSVVGAGLMGASLIPNAGLADQIKEYEDGVRLDPNPARDTSRYEAITSKQSTGKALLFSGMGLAVIGAGLILVEVMRSTDSDVAPEQPAQALTPTLHLTPGGAALGLGWRF